MCGRATRKTHLMGNTNISACYELQLFVDVCNTRSCARESQQRQPTSSNSCRSIVCRRETTTPQATAKTPRAFSSVVILVFLYTRDSAACIWNAGSNACTETVPWVSPAATLIWLIATAVYDCPMLSPEERVGHRSPLEHSAVSHRCMSPSGPPMERSLWPSAEYAASSTTEVCPESVDSFVHVLVDHNCNSRSVGRPSSSRNNMSGVMYLWRVYLQVRAGWGRLQESGRFPPAAPQQRS